MESHGIDDIAHELFLLLFTHQPGIEKMFCDFPQTPSDRNFR